MIKIINILSDLVANFFEYGLSSEGYVVVTVYCLLISALVIAVIAFIEAKRGNMNNLGVVGLLDLIVMSAVYSMIWPLPIFMFLATFPLFLLVIPIALVIRIGERVRLNLNCQK